MIGRHPACRQAQRGPLAGNWLAPLVVLCTIVAGCQVPLSRASPNATPGRTAGVAGPGRISSSRAGPTLAILVGGQSQDTLQLVRRDGSLVARTTLSASQSDRFPVQLAGGAAFFLDAGGLIRRLSRDGRVQTITTLPIVTPPALGNLAGWNRPQVAFAVSPTGEQVIASIVSAPPPHSPLPQQLGDQIWAPGSSWTYQLLVAKAGSDPVTVFQRETPVGSLSDPYPPPFTEIAGWDSVGPLAVINRVFPQFLWISDRYVGGGLIHLGLDGTHLDRVGGTDCYPLTHSFDGTTACVPNFLAASEFSVRSVDGQVVWSGSLPATAGRWGPDWSLSPDERALATGNAVFSSGGSVASVSRLNGPCSGCTGYDIQGWVDNSTVIGVGTDKARSLETVQVGRPDSLHSIGVSGQFVGLL